MPNDPGLELSWKPKGHSGKGTLLVTVNDAPIFMDTGDLTSDAFRKKCLSAVCKDRPAIRSTDIEKRLVELAAQVVQRQSESPDTTSADTGEIQIVRPERFIHPAVSGLTVPERAIVDGRPAGRWALYLRWADGKRERRDLISYLQLSDGARLYINPQPTEPLPTASPGWSRASQKAWLGGQAAPNGADVFAALCERIAYFIDLPPSKAAGITATLALWMMLTYVYPAFDAVPYLYSGGPVGSGKSRVLELLARMVFRPLTTSNLTAACLFRALHNQGGILLLDEAERLRDASPDVADINSVLLAGYKRGGKALRLEPAGDTFKLAEFEVFGPKAIASIAGMPPALASRCIPLTMFRSPPSSVKPRRRLDGDPARWQSLRDDLHRLALENGDTWLDLAQKADVCPEMSGRQFELWQPILALAHWVESSGAEGLLEVVRGHALHTIDDSRDDQLPDTDEVLLRVVSEKVKLGEVFTPGNVLSAAQAKEQVLFQKWSARTVSDRLHRYGIPRPSKHSHGTRLYDGITIDMLLKVQQNYGIDLEISPPSPPKQDLQHAKSNSRLDIDSGGEGGECGEAGRQCREV